MVGACLSLKWGGMLDFIAGWHGYDMPLWAGGILLVLVSWGRRRLRFVEGLRGLSRGGWVCAVMGWVEIGGAEGM